ncbi:MAG: type II toxin-antitoxin system HicA family toxin [Candidatus Kapabacteria bacterium]|jgi:predicted RNA binding protein YcfA (HicA-like mRNA interferase family)|nr:type II toxin-antitoxin system HicA family toxin [Candidatus Kapabacteria bacterium]MCO5252712.1 type II toxin-antitoxin system HicA family toxin [Candidatus Kapabacteria bacterium]
MKVEKILKKLIAGTHNVKFGEMLYLLEAFGFELDRTKGSHHIFKHVGINEIVNIQNVNGEVKSYQVKQVLTIIERNSLTYK